MTWIGRIGIAVFASILAATPGKAWWGDGHALLAAAAVAATPAELPAFFRRGTDHVAHISQDQDLFKNRSTPHLLKAESPDHFFNSELVEGLGGDLPGNRYSFIASCQGAGIQPEGVGFLPYSLAEWTERLAVAFAEHRRWPDNPVIHGKCLTYAGFIAHYAADAVQPLHVTIHADGRVQEDGTVIQKGIHGKVDGLVQEMGFDPVQLSSQARVVVLDSLLTGILAEVDASRSWIERAYRLEPHLRDRSRADVQAFAHDRAVAAAGFTATLYLTAWRHSERIQLPDWHDRR